MSDASTDPSEATSPRKRVTPVVSLASLIGSHPGALRDIYSGGRPADPGALGDAPRGRVLALEPGSDVFMLIRPLIRVLASDHFPWRGKVFDHGGNSGQNVVFGKPMFRFHAEVAPSEIDGAPTLRLDYSAPAFKNPWLVRGIVDELRTVGEGIALGNAFLDIAGKKRLLFWWGLETAQSH